MTAKPKSGYYTVLIGSEGGKVPYIVLASSDYHAARIVRDETGYMAPQHDIDGPYLRL